MGELTLYEVYKQIEQIMLRQPNIRLVVPEFTDLNREDTLYTAAVIQQREHSVGDGYVTYRFYLGYVDRLTETKDNSLQIQSEGIQCLQNVINSLNSNGIDVSNGMYIVFNQRFTAECSGVYTDVSINIPVTDCAMEY